MLRIRLTRTGKKSQPSFRIVVAEHTNPVKRKYLERLGQYIPAAEPKVLTLDKERIEYWLSQGAQPSDTLAGLLKKEGFDGMDRFIGKRDLQRTKKKDQKAEGSAEGGAAKEGEAKAAPAEGEAAPEATPETAPEATAEKAEEPKAESKEEPKAEEPKAEESKPEEKPAEEPAPSEEEAPKEAA